MVAGIVGTSSDEEIVSADINPLNADLIKSQLSPLSSDQPLFVHNVANILKRAKTASDIKLVKSVIEQISVQSDLLRKIEEYEELFYRTKGKQKDFEKRDEIGDLTHERDKWRLLDEIESLKNPPPPPPTPPPPKPPKTKAQLNAEKKKQKLKEAEEVEEAERKWLKELSENPNIDKEDIPTIIERRKRARGWLDNI